MRLKLTTSDLIIASNEDFQNIISELKSTTGLTNVIELTNLDKLEFRILEDSNNFGVRFALERKHTLVVVHNSEFRPPLGAMVLHKNGELIFPPLPFPEVGALSVISSSPSVILHKHIVNRFNLNLEAEEATLIIGFDI